MGSCEKGVYTVFIACAAWGRPNEISGILQVIPEKDMAFRIFSLFALLLFSCTGSIPPHKVILIQPFADFTPSQAEIVYRELKIIYPNIVLRTAIPLPSMAYYPVRDRYQADSILRYLGRSGTTDTVMIGLTNKDISTTKGQIRDWGIGGSWDWGNVREMPALSHPIDFPSLIKTINYTKWLFMSLAIPWGLIIARIKPAS